MLPSSSFIRGLSLALLASGAVPLACAAGNGPSSGYVPDGGAPSEDGSVVDPLDAATADGDASTPPVAKPLPAVPFHTSGRWILDAKDQRFKLTSMNWYGAESKDFVVAGLDKAPLSVIAGQIRAAGFNSVRLPWSNELVETDPVVAPARVAANPALTGKHGMEVLDAVIAALAFEGLVVVLDNHVSQADWCCTDTDGNGLWFTPQYPESKWLDDWRTMANRYATQPAVVGVDLRNELRAMPGGAKATWGGADPTLDWRAAAKRGGDAVLAENSKLLVAVEGLDYATDLTGAYTMPLSLAVANRLVWSTHDYAWFHNGLATYDELKTALGNKWGFLLVEGKPYTAPVWLSEFGIAHQPAEISGLWFTSIRKYLDEADIDWAYWSVNGTESTGTTRTLGTEDTFGFLDVTWTKPASPDLAAALAAITPVKQHP